MNADLLRALFHEVGYTPTRLLVATLAGIVIIVGTVFGVWRGPDRGARAAVWVTLAVVMAGILVATVGLGLAHHEGRSIHNFDPLSTIRHDYRSGTLAGTMNLWGNVVLFMPLGACIAWLARGFSLVRILWAVTIGGMFSACIEIAQLTQERMTDIDDVILNTSGALLGAIAMLTVIVVVRLIRWVGLSPAERRARAYSG